MGAISTPAQIRASTKYQKKLVQNGETQGHYYAPSWQHDALKRYAKEQGIKMGEAVNGFILAGLKKAGVEIKKPKK